MKKDESLMEDDLRTEYDLKSLKVRKLGFKRKKFGRIVQLESDVAQMFPNAEAVNEGLRFLIRVMRENQSLAPNVQPNRSVEQIDESL